MQQHLFNHLCTSGHAGFLDDVSITFIDKTDLLKSEDYWRLRLKPWHLLGYISKEVFNVMSPYIYVLIFAYIGSLWHISQLGLACF